MARVARASLAAALVLAASLPAGAQGRAAAVARPAPQASPSPAAIRQLSKAAGDAIDAAVAATMSRDGIPGLTVAVMREGSLRWSAGYGMADVENAVPAGPATMYRLASVSKPMTATAILQLAERGQLDIERPIQTYVPSFPVKPWPVTVRHLLSHQSGLRHYAPGEFESTRHYVYFSEALEMFKRDPLLFEPGTKFRYTTWGYTLLGVAVEGASGLSYLDYLKRNVFAPAGMGAIRDDDVFAIIPGRAAGYVRTAAGELRNSALADTSDKVPGGGLIAPAEDVARFGAALQGGALLSPATFALMTTEQKTSDGQATTSGLGLYLAQRDGAREMWHTGGQQRVSTVLYMRPSTRTAVAMLSNLENVGEHQLALARQVADAAAANP